MGLDRKGFRSTARASVIFLLSLVLALTTFSVAYGDFIPVPKAKVLGIGRIQSTLPETPVTSEGKFVLPAPESSSEQPSELIVPIAREVAPVIVEPEPEPEVVTSAPSTSTPSPGSNTSPSSGWISTMATNYATPGDGFLDCRTASGAYTTTTSMGVAHKYLPLGTKIELYCPKTGLYCVAVVNDRGPYGGYWGGQPDTFDFQMGVTAALGENYGWYEVHYRII